MFRPQPKPEKREKKRKVYRYKRKPSGEREVFLEIWNERPHYCQCCGRWLGTEPKPIFFSHILSKGAFPRFKLKKENIYLEDEQCHRDWETGSRNQDKFKTKNELYQQLKTEYNAR